MADLPIDAQRVIEQLRAVRQAQGASARTWMPSDTFDTLIIEATREPVQDNEHLRWLHQNWDLTSYLAPPEGHGAKAMVKRLQYRLLMAILRPYFDRLQHFLTENLRALDIVSKRTTDLYTSHLHTIAVLRHDLVDFAHSVDDRLDD
jgi:hypothetical protein